MDADGLALATAISAWGNFLWLAPHLRRLVGEPAPAGQKDRPSGASRLTRIVVSGLVAIGVALALYKGLGFVPESTSALAFAIAVSLCCYGLCAIMLRVPEAVLLVRRLRGG